MALTAISLHLNMKRKLNLLIDFDKLAGLQNFWKCPLVYINNKFQHSWLSYKVSGNFKNGKYPESKRANNLGAGFID